MINYYEVLNIPFQADSSEIKSAFRKLMKIYHPDLSGKDERAKLLLIMNAYQILSDEYRRNLYDYELFSGNYENYESTVTLPRNRIRYARRLRNLAEKGLLKKKYKKRDIHYHFEHDIDIFITPVESISGFKAVFELPTRKLCPYCRGSDRRCYYCDGIGRVYSSQPLEIYIPPGIQHGAIIDIDLMETCRVKFSSYTMKNVKIKISILGK